MLKKWFNPLARFCDYSLLYLVIGAITLSLPYFYGSFFYYFLALATPILWIPLEAFFLSKWATTPGKFLFGLFVKGKYESTLSYLQALKYSSFLPGREGEIQQKKTSLKRKIIALATSILFVFAAIYGNALALWSTGLEKETINGWVQYACDEPGFKVAFPKDPESESKELPIPNSNKVLNYEELTSNESKQISYSVSHLKMPGKWTWASHTTILRKVLEQIVQNSEGAILLDKQFTTHGKHRVLDYRVLQGKEEMHGRLIVVGKTLYKLTVTYPESKAKDSQIDPFLNSFEVS